MFVAVWPPPEVLDAIEALPRGGGRDLRWTTRPQWHVTLRFLGECDEDAAGAAFEQIDAATATAVMGPATARFGDRVVQVPVAGVDAIAAATLAATAGLVAPDDRRFRGHLTLARVRGRARVDLKPFAGVPLQAAWPVDEVTLVRSRLDPDGARYDVVARRSLTRNP